jgi:hypothetical protein
LAWYDCDIGISAQQEQNIVRGHLVIAALKVVLGALVGGLAFALAGIYVTFFYQRLPMGFETAVLVQSQFAAAGAIVGAIAALAQCLTSSSRRTTRPPDQH